MPENLMDNLDDLVHKMSVQDNLDWDSGYMKGRKRGEVIAFKDYGSIKLMNSDGSGMVKVQSPLIRGSFRFCIGWSPLGDKVYIKTSNGWKSRTGKGSTTYSYDGLPNYGTEKVDVDSVYEFDLLSKKAKLLFKKDFILESLPFNDLFLMYKTTRSDREPTYNLWLKSRNEEILMHTFTRPISDKKTNSLFFLEGYDFKKKLMRFDTVKHTTECLYPDLDVDYLHDLYDSKKFIFSVTRKEKISLYELELPNLNSGQNTNYRFDIPEKIYPFSDVFDDQTKIKLLKKINAPDSFILNVEPKYTYKSFSIVPEGMYYFNSYENSFRALTRNSASSVSFSSDRGLFVFAESNSNFIVSSSHGYLGKGQYPHWQPRGDF